MLKAEELKYAQEKNSNQRPERPLPFSWRNSPKPLSSETEVAKQGASTQGSCLCPCSYTQATLFIREGSSREEALLKVEILTKPFQTVPAIFSLNLLFCNKILTHCVLGYGWGRSHKTTVKINIPQVNTNHAWVTSRSQIHYTTTIIIIHRPLVTLNCDQSRSPQSTSHLQPFLCQRRLSWSLAFGMSLSAVTLSHAFP